MTETYTRTADVIGHSRSFHGRLARNYRELADKTDAERMRMIFYYLERREKNLESALERFEEGISPDVLDARIQYVPEPEKGDASLDSMSMTPDMSVDKVLRTALRMSEYVISTYESIAAQTAYPEVRETFEELKRLEVVENKRLSRDVQEVRRL